MAEQVQSQAGRVGNCQVSNSRSDPIGGIQERGQASKGQDRRKQQGQGTIRV
ncbi:unnamed protein product, partial [Staurois parvus]